MSFWRSLPGSVRAADLESGERVEVARKIRVR